MEFHFGCIELWRHQCIFCTENFWQKRDKDSHSIVGRAFLVAQLVRIRLQCRRPWFNSWVGKTPWRRDRLPTPVFMGFPGGSDGKELAHNMGDLGLIPGLGKSPGGGHGNPLQYFCLENPHAQRSLGGYSPLGHKESVTTERLSTAQHHWSCDKC